MVELQQSTDIEESETEALTPSEVVLAAILDRLTKIEATLKVVTDNMPSIQFPV